VALVYCGKWFGTQSHPPQNCSLISAYRSYIAICFRPRDEVARCPWKRTLGEGHGVLSLIINPKQPPTTTTLLYASYRPLSTIRRVPPPVRQNWNDRDRRGRTFRRPRIIITVLSFLRSKWHGVRYSQRYLIQLLYILLPYLYTHINDNTLVGYLI